MSGFLIDTGWVNLAYVVASIMFIRGIKGLTHPRTAVSGNLTSALGMLLAVVATLLADGLNYQWILLGAVIGGLVGGVIAVRVQMTKIPEMVALFNGFGGGASVLVAGSAMVAAVTAMVAGTISAAGELNMQMKIATVLSGIIGSVTFFGSYVAFGKLAEFLAVKWKLTTGQKTSGSIRNNARNIFYLCRKIKTIRRHGPTIQSECRFA